MPIVDWHLKRDIMKIELSEDTYKGIFFHALSNKNDPERYQSLLDASKKWDESSPSPAYYGEIANLCNLLFKDGGRDAIQFFVDSDADAFKARIVRARNGGSEAVPQAEWYSESDHVLIALDEERSQSVRASLRSRRLDQKLYYMNVDSADVWHELINIGAYRIYDWCRESLRTMVRSPAWNQALAIGDVETLVALGGGGSASKDFEVLSALVDMNYRSNAPSKTRYVLVDISPHMLMSSMSRIKHYFRREPRANDLVKVEAFAADMLRLSELKPRLRKSNSRNAWFLTGGTIGNFNESELVGSLDKAALPGDLLVVGMDTYDPDGIDASRLRIKDKYRPELMQDFLATPMGILLHHLNSDMPVRKLRERIEVDVVDGSKLGYSVIDGALTAEVKLILGDDDAYTLLTSTRYDLDAFVAWFVARGWKWLGQTAPAEKSATFRQVLFEKVKAK